MRFFFFKNKNKDEIGNKTKLLKFFIQIIRALNRLALQVENNCFNPLYHWSIGKILL